MKRSAGARLPWACSTSDGDARERRVRRRPGRAGDERAGGVQRAGEQLVAGLLVDRHRLAGDRRLVDARVPGRHDRVERDPLAGPDADQGADARRPRRRRAARRRRSARGRGWGRGPSARRRCGGCARAPSPPGRCRPRTARAPTRPRRTRRCRPRRPRRAPSARSCPAAGGAGRAPRRARSASRRPPSRAGTAARRRPAARTPARRRRRRRAARSTSVVESARASRRQNGVSSCSTARAAGRAR